MSLTSEELAQYLGRGADELLADAPFRNWALKESVDLDLAEPEINYVFTDDGMEFHCDLTGRISTIFICKTTSKFFNLGLNDVSFSMSRREVIARHGPSSRSGSPISHPVLGDYGAWDRFVRPGYVLHVEYRSDADVVSRVTLMRPDIVPDE